MSNEGDDYNYNNFEDTNDGTDVYKHIVFNSISKYLTGYARIITFNTSRFSPIEDPNLNEVR